MSRFELSQIPVKPGSYEKPKRSNKNIPEEKYDKVDKTCQEEVFLSNDGNVYVPKEAMNTIFNTTKEKGRFIYDNQLDDEDKRLINGTNAIKSSEVVGLLDKRSHESRDAEDADLDRYTRDSLIRIGDSDQAEAVRRKLDTHTDKELPKLKKQRGTTNDEITGEPLEKNSAFHHADEKELFTDPVDVLDESKGINVNAGTHHEIHRQKIRTNDELQKKKVDVMIALGK
ncbi:hypothetical protein [Anaerosporobacter sp.]|uniref:hypothetical protein n=1 Tax=Anaerosporobacter sp. TaxID=1872529 RepID=UPI00286F4EF7|nr:hypothetical protein [Anaerosporobacter sp.]